MRAVPIERLEKEWEAVEASVVGLVDQNPTVLGRDRMEKLLRLVQKLGKVLVFQSELDFWGHGTDKSRFFDRNPEAVEDNRRREELLKDTVLAVQVGIEGPVEFKGRLGRKNPQVYKEALANLNRLGIITLGTFIIGAPPELFPEEHREAMKPFTPWEGQTDAEWRDILDEWADWITYQVPTAAPIPFSFSVIPGTPAYEWLKEQGLLKVTLEELLGGRDPMTNFFRSQDPNIVIGMGDIRKTTEGVRERIYKLRPVLKRLGYTKLSFWKWLFMVAFNKMAGATLGPKMG
jgi:hypothetical protein